MAGAAVSFDPENDLFPVTGQMTLRVQYDSSLLGFALHHDFVSGYAYNAQLFWDGQKAVLVTIHG